MKQAHPAREAAVRRADWHARPWQDVLSQLQTGSQGLSATEARRRLEAHGPNRLAPPRRRGPRESWVQAALGGWRPPATSAPVRAA